MRVAAVQLNSTADRAANLAVADRLTRAAAADGASLIVLPEKWTAMGSDEQLRAAAETLDGPAIEWARATARELGVDLVAGSILERVAGQEKLANTSVHVDPQGEVKAVYRKLHMFDVEVGGRVLPRVRARGAGRGDRPLRDRRRRRAGAVDLLRPALPRAVPDPRRAGARIIALPAAFTLATTRDHWETLVRARAIENQAFVIAANQVGAHPAGQHSGGRSMIVDPWGRGAGAGPDSEGHIVAELDLEGQHEIRARLPSLANRRPEAYRWPEEVRA